MLSSASSASDPGSLYLSRFASSRRPTATLPHGLRYDLFATGHGPSTPLSAPPPVLAHQRRGILRNRPTISRPSTPPFGPRPPPAAALMPPRSIKTHGKTLAPVACCCAQGDASGLVRTPRSTAPAAALDAAVLDDDPGQDAVAGHQLRAQVFPRRPGR